MAAKEDTSPLPRELTDAEVLTFRTRLCESFKKLFAEKGYAAVTMRALAEDIGCSPMTPYRYFQDKEEILAATRAAGFRLLFDEIESAIDEEKYPVERSRLACVTFLRFAQREPETYRIMYTTTQPDVQAYPELSQQIERARRVITELAESVPEVRSSTMKPAAVAQAFWGALHGVISIHLADGFDEETSFDEIVAILMSVLVEGGRALFRLPRDPQK